MLRINGRTGLPPWTTMSRDVLPEDVLLLLPIRPRSALVATSDPQWERALRHWGIARVHEHGEVAISVSPTTTVAVPGGARRPVVRYRARVGRNALRLVPRRLPGRASVVLRGPGVRRPAVVAAALGGGRLRSVLLGDDPRRRAALVVTTRWRRRVVVKCVRRPGVTRGPDEQAALRTLLDLDVAAPVPVALGAGDHDGISWSVESFAAGTPLSRARRSWRLRHGWAVLDGLAAWLDHLARASASGACVGGGSPPLRGRASERLGGLVDSIGAPGVLCHGDLASGENLLVRGRRFTVIDWETARIGPPLLDLLPTLCLGAARIAGAHGNDQVASFVVALARGEHRRSPWLFQRVATHLAAVGLPPEAAGPLAAVAWGYQASMRARHDELVVSEGMAPRAWISPAEVIFDRWWEDARLGPDWPAFLDVATR